MSTEERFEEQLLNENDQNNMEMHENEVLAEMVATKMAHLVMIKTEDSFALIQEAVNKITAAIAEVKEDVKRCERALTQIYTVVAPRVKYCSFCKTNTHVSESCRTFPTTEARKIMVTSLGKCEKCLASVPTGDRCKCNMKCSKCGIQLHAALHDCSATTTTKAPGKVNVSQRRFQPYQKKQK